MSVNYDTPLYSYFKPRFSGSAFIPQPGIAGLTYFAGVNNYIVYFQCLTQNFGLSYCFYVKLSISVIYDIPPYSYFKPRFSGPALILQSGIAGPTYFVDSYNYIVHFHCLTQIFWLSYFSSINLADVTYRGYSSTLLEELLVEHRQFYILLYCIEAFYGIVSIPLTQASWLNC